MRRLRREDVFSELPKIGQQGYLALPMCWLGRYRALWGGTMVLQVGVSGGVDGQ